MTEKGKVSLMRISSTAKYALGVTAAAAMLAGCSSGASSLSPTTPVAGAQASHGSAVTLIAKAGLKVVPTHDTRPSQMSPDAKKAGQYLYVSDSGTDDVQVYAWPKPKNPVGTLTGFNEPQGACADTSGNVYITNTGDKNILEYKGGATSPSQTLVDPDGYPVGCSVDPKSGNIAVTNIINNSYGQGNIDVFAGGKGTPKSYSNAGIFKPYFVGYDNKGTAWVSGINSSYAPVLASLNKQGKIKVGTVSGASILFPGSTEFDGKVVTTGDQEGAVAYQLKKFKATGNTPLTGSSDIVQYWIDGGTSLIGPDAGNADVEIYKYPAGGSPSQTLTGFSEPIGAAVTSK